MFHNEKEEKRPMTKSRIKPVTAAVCLALASMGTAHAQSAPEKAPELGPDGKPLPAASRAETIEVVGIRASLEKSIAVKKDAATNVEVVTAEDVGKMPDKNIADALSRLTGVNVQYGLALAMDEAERVAI